MSSIAGQQSSASVAAPNPASSLPPSWTAAAPVKSTKLHELIAACTALPTHNTTGDDKSDGDDDDEEFGGGAAISMWQPVMNRIYTHPGECRRKDQRQRNPLHCAVARLPPPCIVRALIEASSAIRYCWRRTIGAQRLLIEQRSTAPASGASGHYWRPIQNLRLFLTDLGGCPCIGHVVMDSVRVLRAQPQAVLLKLAKHPQLAPNL